MGDSISWEWMVDCASRERADPFIVSRDSDYRSLFQSQYINDHLKQEFAEPPTVGDVAASLAPLDPAMGDAAHAL